MKFVKYNLFQSYDDNNNPILLEVTIKYDESIMDIVRAEAYDERYEIIELEVEENEDFSFKSNQELTEENEFLKIQIDSLQKQMTFYEDCIAEMAMIVYS